MTEEVTLSRPGREGVLGTPLEIYSSNCYHMIIHVPYYRAYLENRDFGSWGVICCVRIGGPARGKG